jgi:hypothetical protein
MNGYAENNSKEQKRAKGKMAPHVDLLYCVRRKEGVVSLDGCSKSQSSTKKR